MTHHETYLDGVHDVERRDSPFAELADALKTDAYRLKLLTASTSPLTIEKLARLDPAAADRAELLDMSGIGWPDAETAALRPEFASTFTPLLDGDADLAFIVPILRAEQESAKEDQSDKHKPAQDDDQGWAQGYNNFPILLKAKQWQASPAVLRERMAAGDMLGLTYGTKPYLERAYAVAPEFMQALQRSIEAVGGMDAWKHAVATGYVEYDEASDNANLLTASRIAFVLLARLMRSDDLQIQKRLLGFPDPTAPLIKNPANELAT